jgi:hypothetical protein
MNNSKALKALQWSERHWQWVLIPLLIITALLWLFALAPLDPQNFARALFYTLQFIVLNKDVYDGVLKNAPQPLVIGLNISQFLIPFVVSVAFFGALFRNHMSPFFVRKAVSGLTEHHVVIGYGAIGQALSLSLSKIQKNVVVVDTLANTQVDLPNLFHLQMDALSPSLFDAANLGRAARIYLLLPDESQNLTILKKLVERSRPDIATVYVRAESSALRRLLTDSIWLENWMADIKKNKDEKQNKLDVRPVNPYDIVARGIVNEYSPDLYAPTDRNGDIAQTIMIVGVSEMAKALILRFARLGIYSPKGKLRLIWAGKGVSDAFRELADTYPSLSPSTHRQEHWGLPFGASPDYLRFVVTPLDIVILDEPASQAIRDIRVKETCGKQIPSVVYVCHDSDIENAIEARDLQASLCTHLPAFENAANSRRLILAIQNQSAVGVAQADDMLPYNVYRYDIKEVCIDPLFAETLANDRADDLAKKFDAAYSNLATVDSNKWNSYSFFVKELNRDPADHAAIKARYAGVEASMVKECFIDGKIPLGADGELLERHHEDLELMELRRYRAFMFLHGFSHGAVDYELQQLNSAANQQLVEKVLTNLPEEERKAILKKLHKDLERGLRKNPTLLDENLSPAEKSKDSSIVNVTKRALAMGIAK